MTTVLMSEKVQFAVTPEMKQAAQRVANEWQTNLPTVYRVALGLFLARGIDYSPELSEPTNGNAQPDPARSD